MQQQKQSLDLSYTGNEEVTGIQHKMDPTACIITLCWYHLSAWLMLMLPQPTQA
jgi:hypothetical protein